MRKVSHKAKDSEHVELDETYWRDAILQKDYYREEIGFDRYRWALQYGQKARKVHGNKLDMKELLEELAEGWVKFGGPSGMTWEEAREAVMDSWNYTDLLLADGLANRGAFKTPPTFAEHGTRVPRNVDEPNG